jgi:predicted phosphate transport protein (TIGR00153 family)
MFKFLFKKEHQIEELIYKYLENIKMTQESFSKALDDCFFDPYCDNFDFYIQQTHKYESRADDIREEIKDLMYRKALIPDSRGDIMGLVETLDEIPGLFETTLYIIQTQKLVLPEFIVKDFTELLRFTLESCDILLKQVEALFRKTDDMKAFTSKIDRIESHCDHIERRIVTRIFDSELDPFEKLQLKELVIHVGNVSDQADRVSRRIYIISIKRRV